MNKKTAAVSTAKPTDPATHPAAVAAALAPCAGIIEPRPPGDLKPNPRNARTHGNKQVQLLAAGIVWSEPDGAAGAGRHAQRLLGSPLPERRSAVPGLHAGHRHTRAARGGR